MSIKKLSLLLILPLLVLGCSPKRNTYMNRKYHNLTAYFNVYFNGKDAHKLSMKSLERMEPESFDEILPVFSFDFDGAAGSVSGEMQRVITKGEKTIKKHSITAKPKKKKNLSKEQKEFFNRNEFNNWIDEAQLLIAKALVTTKEYDLADEKLNFILTTYPKEYATIAEARLYKAILAIKAKEYLEAENTLRSLSRSKRFPETLTSTLHATYANLYIEQGKYPEAISSLEKSMQTAKGKHTKIRYNYILAQLNQATGNNAKAVEYYEKVVKKNPPYHTTFSAEMAIAFLSTGKDSEERMRKMLTKALRNEQNENYKDQIYYAFAKLEEKAGNTEKAIEYYYKSVDAGGTNNKQKGQSYLALAEHYIAQPDYIKAYTCYDNSARMLGLEHSLYDKVFGEAKKLHKLAVNLKVLEVQDSLQLIAKMPEDERNKLLKDKAKALNDAEELRQLQAEKQAASPQTNQQGRFPSGGAGQWYFYNQSALNMGKAEFSTRWGGRKLEDNWRRKDKNMSYDFDYDTEIEPENKDILADNKVVVRDSVVTGDALLANIPVGEKALKESDGKIVNAMFNVGEAFRDDLKITDKAIESLEKLDNRFTVYSLQSSNYVALYNLYLSVGNTERANYYKNLMQVRYPSEPQVMALLDPSYVGRKHQEEIEHELVYNSALSLYTAGQNQSAYNAAQQAISKYPTSRLVPQFYLLMAMSDSYDGNVGKYSSALKKIKEDYPKSEAAKSVGILLASLSENDLKLIADDESEGIDETVVGEEYSDKEGVHFLAVIIDVNEDVGKLQFNISLFNANNYLNQNYDLQTMEFGDNKQMVVVGEFKNKKTSLDYLRKMSAKKDIFESLTKEYICFLISDENMFKLSKSKDIIGYNAFYKAKYLK